MSSAITRKRGAIQSRDTCVLEVAGRLVRAAAQGEAFNRILNNRVLYCAVGANNNGNRTVHNIERVRKNSLKRFQMFWRASGGYVKDTP